MAPCCGKNQEAAAPQRILARRARSQSSRAAPSSSPPRYTALDDEVAETGQEVIVTKRGKPVARLVPLVPKVHKSLLGSVLKQGDLVAPIGGHWDADR